MALIALVVQSVLLVFFYSLPDPLGLSMAEMFEGKTLWQIFMAFGAVLAMAGLFGFARAPRGLAVFYALYFFIAVADYDVFRFSHQRLSYSFLRTYFHISNITDATTVSTLGGDLLGTVLWVSMVVLCFAGAIAFVVAYTLHLRARRQTLVLDNRNGAWKPASRKIPGVMFAVGMALSLVPLVLFLTGTRGWIEIPVTHTKVDMRFTLGKHTLTAPILHIAAVETFEICAYHYGDVVSMAFGFKPAKCFAILPASAFRFMGNRKGGNRYSFVAFLRGIPWHREFLET